MLPGTTQQVRTAAVWSAVTTGVAAAWTLAGRPAARVVDHATWSGDFAALLEPVCAIAFLGAAGWLWTLTTVTVAGVLRGRTPGAGTGAVRRLVLLACGVAVAAGAAAPVAAVGAGEERALVGLRLPDRAVGSGHAPEVVRPAPPAQRVAQPADPDVHVVRPGDSLWSVAEQTSGPGADLDARWRDIWAANRDLVGDDPDLILPGQRLRLPSSDPGTTTNDSPTNTDRGTAPDQTGDRP